MGWDAIPTLLNGIFDRWFSSKRKFVSIRKKIERYEDEMEDIIKNKPANDDNRKRCHKLQQLLADLNKELSLSAD